MNDVDNPKSIKFYVKNFLLREKERFSGKKIMDFPAGNGVTSDILKSIDAIPLPYDLFPESFNVDGLTCLKANIMEGIPLEDESVDAVISQEGIEHFENQLKAMHEFNRVIKVKGSLILTTPNYSSMTGRLSYFLSESEIFNKQMPLNELDDIWFASKKPPVGLYYGHIFLIGLSKLRLLAKVSGFKIKNIEKTKIKSTSVMLLMLFYPFILLSNWLSYQRNIRKNNRASMAVKKQVYGEIFRLAVNPRNLVNSHIFIEFEKEFNVEMASNTLLGVHQSIEKT